ncbi:MAG TPA: ATP-binding cassette domain-containing protein [Gammaproteobacteria bacterium]|nr:ATP-binding cassette domain-containing protein [Gammaproteobacteria bacterium]
MNTSVAEKLEGHNSAGELLLQASAISYRRHGKNILDNISLDIREREIITLIGPNGAGKTSLVRILLGLARAGSGKITRHKKLRIGYVPQRIHIPDVMPLRVLDFLNVSGNYSEDECRQILAEVSCDYLLSAPMQTVSGGEMQRVLLARALLKQPQLLVLDEPASGMDVVGQQALYETLREIRDKKGCGILLVSHDLHLVMAATDRVICLNTHVCCTGRPDDVTANPEYLKLFGHAIDGLALYEHHHDHEHDLHGNIIASEHCIHCEHNEGRPDKDVDKRSDSTSPDRGGQ